MNLEKYNIEESEDFMEYWFYSKGPKGMIKKVVTFTPIEVLGYRYFNLSLGDWDEQLQITDDTIRSNNQDTEKVLASVADIIIRFSDRNPKSFIVIEANTKSKLRLYQIKINKYLKDIIVHFELHGLSENTGLIPYTPGNKCLGFAAKRKEV